MRKSNPHSRDIVVIGAPSGGATAVARLIGSLPAQLDAAFFVVLHTTPQTPILLADILNAPGRLRAAAALHGEPVTHHRIYVPVLGRHLLIRDGAVHLSDDGHAVRHRPSIDLLFSSAAEAYTSRVVGVLLLHAREDGGIGLGAIRRAGGRTVTHRNELMPEAPKDPKTGELLSDDHVFLEEISGRVTAYVQSSNWTKSARAAT
jgi:two-component system chemotaxis response regulator CheB